MEIDTLKVETLNSKTFLAFVFDKFHVKNIARADVFVLIFQIQQVLASEYFIAISSTHVASPYFRKYFVKMNNIETVKVNLICKISYCNFVMF